MPNSRCTCTHIYNIEIIPPQRTSHSRWHCTVSACTLYCVRVLWSVAYMDTTGQLLTRATHATLRAWSNYVLVMTVYVIPGIDRHTLRSSVGVFIYILHMWVHVHLEFGMECTLENSTSSRFICRIYHRMTVAISNFDILGRRCSVYLKYIIRLCYFLAS
jgi:hypothetical protein